MTTTATTLRVCPECSTRFEVAKKQRTFCSPTCKQIHANRRTVRGKAIVAIAMGWRQGRGSGDLSKFLMSEMCEMLDAFNAEDHAAGRMRAADYAALVTEYKVADTKYYPKGYTAKKFMDRKN